MINSKEDYKKNLNADRLARGIIKTSFKEHLKKFIRPKPTLEFQKRPRKLEYYMNCKNDIFSKLYLVYLNYRFRELSLKLNFSIPPNVFGPGLCILHQGTIVVNSKAKVRKNCKLVIFMVIGASGVQYSVPTIGDNVYIGSGAKIYGNITLGNNIAIAAYSAVNKDFLEENVLIGGIPVKKIEDFI